MSEDNKNDDNKNDDKYDLYTEHIVHDGWKKVKKYLKKIAYVLVMAIVFGLVAGLVMIIVYKTGRRFTEEEPTRPNVTLESVELESDTSSHEDVTLSTTNSNEVETTTAIPLNWGEDTLNGLNNVSDMYAALKNVANRVNLSSVTVTTSSDQSIFNSTYQKVSERYGVILTVTNDFCYIVTSYDQVKGVNTITVTFADHQVLPATYIAGDVTTGLAIVSTSLPNMTNIQQPILGDSTTVSMGDAIVAVGDLYGFNHSIGYGIATGTGNVISDTDSSFNLITTNIPYGDFACGVIANLNGEIVGFITTNYDTGKSSLIQAYDVSSIKKLLENMTNGITKPYLGIKGMEVTDAIQGTGNMPKGIYVSTVESNSPAYYAGIQSGDIITKVGEKTTLTMSSFMSQLTLQTTDAATEITIKRLGKEGYREITYSIVLAYE